MLFPLCSSVSREDNNDDGHDNNDDDHGDDADGERERKRGMMWIR